MSRFVMLTYNSFTTLAFFKDFRINDRLVRCAWGIFQDCMIMVAIVMFAVALTLMVGS